MKAGNLLCVIEAAERDARLDPDVFQPRRSLGEMDQAAALDVVKAHPASFDLLADAELLRSYARLGDAAIDLSTDAPVVMEVAEMLSRDDPEPNLARAALDVHRRAWHAHRILLALADTVQNAERVCGTNKADLYADDEVPF